ncbi:MAG: carboxy-S-adenosyl-L-methionine synthase CmoA [Pseudomonadales bacterium]|nr:carboxy-S-adenosyl-L-methionine synthase CmoA [Pseudomonadales bacterium]
MNSTPRDTIYSSPKKTVEGFTFDEEVVSVFPDMIGRSVPGYNTSIEMLPILADRYLQKDSNIYDLGCSLGASTLPIMPWARQRNCNIIAVDNSTAMLEKCRQVISQHSDHSSVELVCNDLLNVDFDRSSMTIMNYTLQFVPIEQRLRLLTDIQNATLSGGVVVLSEKITFHEPQINTDMIELHQAFKGSNGYSALEISQKRAALENVLIPEHYSVHQERLYHAGFSRVQVICQTLNFCTMLAIK